MYILSNINILYLFFRMSRQRFNWSEGGPQQKRHCQNQQYNQDFHAGNFQRNNHSFQGPPRGNHGNHQQQFDFQGPQCKQQLDFQGLLGALGLLTQQDSPIQVPKTKKDITDDLFKNVNQRTKIGSDALHMLQNPLLYGLYPCLKCGARIDNSQMVDEKGLSGTDRVAQHLDIHFLKSQNPTKLRVRGWYESTKDWGRQFSLSFEEKAKICRDELGLVDASDEKINAIVYHRIVDDDTPKSCQECGESFGKTWFDQDAEEWIYTDLGVILPNNVLYHVGCVPKVIKQPEDKCVVCLKEFGATEMHGIWKKQVYVENCVPLTTGLYHAACVPL